MATKSKRKSDFKNLTLFHYTMNTDILGAQINS